MESNPFRVIPLLGDSSPCRGILFFRYREHSRRRVIIEAYFEESRVVALMLLDITCIRILDLNICLYKSVINGHPGFGASQLGIRAKVNNYLGSSVGVVISLVLIPASQHGIRGKVYDYL